MSHLRDLDQGLSAAGLAGRIGWRWPCLGGVAHRAMAAVGLAAALSPAPALAGAPMVTDDTDTPGDGRWEVNLVATAGRTRAARERAAPDLDLNYGWGTRAQVKLDLPWVSRREAGQGWKSGPGAASLGLKWRFFEEEGAAFSASIFPQYTLSPPPSSVRRGIANPGHQFFLPLEVGTPLRGTTLGAEVGRRFTGGNAGQWELGAFAARACAQGLECMLEVRETVTARRGRTLLNFGLQWKLDDSMSLLAAAGREFVQAVDEPRQSLLYLALQARR